VSQLIDPLYRRRHCRRATRNTSTAAAATTSLGNTTVKPTTSFTSFCPRHRSSIHAVPIKKETQTKTAQKPTKPKPPTLTYRMATVEEKLKQLAKDVKTIGVEQIKGT
jgi:hypothetical protein